VVSLRSGTKGGEEKKKVSTQSAEGKKEALEIGKDFP